MSDTRTSAQIVMLLENNPYPQDTRVRNEAETLSEAGHAVTVLAPRGAGQARRERINGVEVRRYRMLWAGGSPLSYVAEYGVAHAQLLGRALVALARGARVLHFHGPPDTLFVAAVLARASGREAVFDLHDSAPELFAAKFGSSRALSWALRGAQRRAMRHASHVIVTNETQRELVISRAGRRESDISIVRNGPRAREFGEPSEPRAGALQAPRLIYVGALDTQDGALELADLMASPHLVQATLTVVGDGPLLEELRARCARLGVAGRVQLKGRVAHEQVPQLLAEADIGVDPAPGTELNHGSTMIKVVEYMGAGRPLVAYDLRETRRSAGAGASYAPCGERDTFAGLVAELARDGELRLRLAAHARARAGELAWERQASVLRGVYGRLLAPATNNAESRKYAAPHPVTRP